MNYVFTGPSPRFYPDIVTDTGSLIAEPGDVREFDEPPADGLWMPTDAAATNPSPRQWPLKAEAPTVAEVPAVIYGVTAATTLSAPPAVLTSEVPETQES